MLNVTFASSASALFWLTGVIAVLTIGLLVIGAGAWRSSLVKRRLLCSVVSCTRLLAAPEPVRKDLEILFEGQSLSDPYVVALEIANVGRASIPSELFDKGRGLAFALNSPILKILTVDHEPAFAPAPAFSVANNQWEMKPELIVKGEVIQLSVLAAGPVDGLALNESPLADVNVQVRDREAWMAQRERFRNVLLGAVTALSTALLILFGNIVANEIAKIVDPQSANATGKFGTVIACHNMSQTVGLLQSSIYAAHSQITVTRDSTGRLRRIHFGSSYKTQAALAAAASIQLLDADILVTGRTPGTKFIAVRDTIGAASGSLGRLPADGIGSKADRDLQRISAGLKLLTSNELTPLACVNL